MGNNRIAVALFLGLSSLLWLVPSAEAGTLQVTSTQPVRHTVAAKDTAITIRFDRAVQQASITNASLRAYGRWTGPVSGAISFSDGDSVVTLTPSRPFSAGETVFVNLSHDIEGSDNSPLRSAGYAFQFRIAAAPAQRVFDPIDTMSVRDGSTPNPRIYGGQASDVDLDGWLDLSIINEDTGDIRVFMNRGDGSGLYDPYLEPPATVGIGASPNEPGDFNNDGFPDIATANVIDATVTIVLGNGDGTFSAPQAVAVGAGPKGLAVLDVDGDGDKDLVTANFGGNNMSLLLNNGVGTFSVTSTFEGGVNGEHGLAAADMNNDGIYDLVIGARTGQQVIVHLGNGDGTFTPSTAQASGGGVWMLICGDVNGDGNLDVSTANGSSANGSILLGNGNGTLASAQVMAASGFSTATDLGDLDGDGDLDWVLSAFGGGRWRLFTNNSSGTYTFDQDFPATSNPGCSVLFDFDNDDDLDIALLDELADLVVLMRNRNSSDIFADGFESGDTTAWSATGP